MSYMKLYDFFKLMACFYYLRNKNTSNAFRIPLLTVFLLLVWAGSTYAQSQDMVETEGWFTIVWGDSRPGAGGSAALYSLTEASGKTWALEIDPALATPFGGIVSLNRKYVAINGYRQNLKALNNTSAPAANRSPAVQVSSLSLAAPSQPLAKGFAIDDQAAVAGSKPWVSIMCKFSDHSATEPENLSYFQEMYAIAYPGLDHYWQEVSYNTVNISGSDAFGWFVLPEPESYYNPTDTLGGTDLDLLRRDCIAAADASVDFSGFAGINMMFNSNFDNGYAWGGSRYMTLDGATKLWSITWEPPWGYADITVIAHEMGHGFGLPHSSGMYGETYDNEWDVMSDSWANCGNSNDATYGCLGQHTIAYHKDILGWIPTGERYVTEGVNVTLTLDQLASQAVTHYRMVKIPLPETTSRYYTLEVRKKSGYDIKLPGKAVVIHEVDTSRQRPANVVDVDGNGNTGDAGAMWVTGEIYNEPGGNFSVEILNESANGYQVSIQFHGSGSDLVIDSLEFSKCSLKQGESYSISATVRNRGTELTAETTTLRFYRSTDSTITTDDTEMSNYAVASLNSGEIVTESHLAVAPSEPGVYYVGACVDTVSGEQSAENNCSSGTAISVATTSSQADFPWSLFLPAIIGTNR